MPNTDASAYSGQKFADGVALSSQHGTVRGKKFISSTAIPRLVRVMRSKKIAFVLTEFALIEAEYM